MARILKPCRWLSGLIIVFSIETSAGAPAEVSLREVYIVTGDSAPASRQMADALLKRIHNAKLISEADAALQKRKNALYIAVGQPAFQSLTAQNLDSAILALLTSSQAFRAIVDSSAKVRNRDISAIYADASPFNQLKLAASVNKNHASIVTFLSAKTAYLRPILQRAAAQASVDLEIVQLSGDELLTQELDQSASSRGVLALPDSSLYTPENIRAMLITTYRQNQFVIGYSSSFVKAGALASTYSTIEDIASQASEVTKEYGATGRLPTAQYPKYFAVSINDNVARSLNIIISDETRNFSHKPPESP